MNKLKSIAAIGLLFAATVGNAQPVISSSVSLPPVGYTDTVSGVSTANYGSAGANVTWNFSSLAAVPNDIVHVVTPASTPYSATFPTANYALKYTSFAGATLFYEYAQVNSNAWDLLAQAWGSSNFNYSANPLIRFPFPFSYGDTRTDIVQLTGYSSYTRTITYDGYGALLVPGATYNNVVRLNYNSDTGFVGYKWFTTSPLMLVAVWDRGTSRMTFIGKYLLTGMPCKDIYEPNEAANAAKAVVPQNDITARISTATDKDWYSFNTTPASPNIKVSLINLPKNYTLALYKNNSLQATSQNSGTTPESIILNETRQGNYKIQVYSAGVGEFDAASCYTLQIETSSTAYTSSQSSSARMAPGNSSEAYEAISVYPNPAKSKLSLNYVAIEAGPAFVSITDLVGRIVMTKQFEMQQGANSIDLSLSNYTAGTYFLNVAGCVPVRFQVVE